MPPAVATLMKATEPWTDEVGLQSSQGHATQLACMRDVRSCRVELAWPHESPGIVSACVASLPAGTSSASSEFTLFASPCHLHSLAPGSTTSTRWRRR